MTQSEGSLSWTIFTAKEKDSLSPLPSPPPLSRKDKLIAWNTSCGWPTFFPFPHTGCLPGSSPMHLTCILHTRPKRGRHCHLFYLHAVPNLSQTKTHLLCKHNFTENISHFFPTAVLIKGFFVFFKKTITFDRTR